MMLSVLIVNYRVRYFLEHCLLSVLAAAELALQRGDDSKVDRDIEILVFDNDPSEGSIEVLRPRFPTVQFFAAPENLGFGKANNFLIARASGKYVLFLNPDTILPENCFTEQIAFLESHPVAAASGIRMIDGSGAFLPESKRGFPGLWASFCKIAGLSAVFPSSRMFAGYYQGQLDPSQSHQVPILSGAHMMVKASVLATTGGFDPQFFMYAEDIDLSYRIIKAGFKNYYFAGATIIHFKGESTRKDKKYVRQFYLAMIQFVRKHFSGGGGMLLIRMLELAIRLKAGISSASVAPEQNAAGDNKWGNNTSHKDEQSEKQAGINTTAASTFLTGDEVSKALCRQRYSHLRFVVDEEQSVQTIFCCGRSFSNARLIASMEASKAAVKKIFHPLAMAVVGSNSKSRQGTAETFEN